MSKIPHWVRDAITADVAQQEEEKLNEQNYQRFTEQRGQRLTETIDDDSEMTIDSPTNSRPDSIDNGKPLDNTQDMADNISKVLTNDEDDYDANIDWNGETRQVMEGVKPFGKSGPPFPSDLDKFFPKQKLRKKQRLREEMRGGLFGQPEYNDEMPGASVRADVNHGQAIRSIFGIGEGSSQTQAPTLRNAGSRSEFGGNASTVSSKHRPNGCINCKLSQLTCMFDPGSVRCRTCVVLNKACVPALATLKLRINSEREVTAG